MRFVIYTALVMLMGNSLFAQEKQPVFSGIFQEPLFKEITNASPQTSQWHIGFEFLYKKSKEDIFQTKYFKQLATQKKLSTTVKSPRDQEKKYRTLSPTLGTNFKGNELKSWTPTDNTVAVSDSGHIVSCVNWGIEYYDTSGNILLYNQTWDGFFNDSTLNQAKFDPRVIYDNKHKRFILVLLHGFSSATNKILVCFSKTPNPSDGWYVYRLSGNPYNDTAWTDYPVIGVNNDDLFIAGNQFGDPPSYPWKGGYMYQISIANGLSGLPFDFGLWNNIYGPDGEEVFTMYPASHGFGEPLHEKMYFVHMRPDTGSKVYVYELTGKLQSPTKILTSKQFNIPHYEVCGNAFQKDPTTGNIDSLSTASAMVQNAFYNNKNIHFTFSADVGAGWCGIHYGRVKLDSNKATVRAFGFEGTDMSYPAVAAFGRDTNDQSAVIAFVRSDSSRTPECNTVGIDHTMKFSDQFTVKAGDTVVNILYPPDYPIMPERWGDYTGIARLYGTTKPEVWMAGAYGANTLPRKASYGTWIAQLKNDNAPVGVSNVEKNNSNTKVYPNPIRDMFTIELDIKKTSLIQVDIYSIDGKRIRNLFNDKVPESLSRLSFNKLALPSGTYIIQVKDEEGIFKKEKVLVD